VETAAVSTPSRSLDTTDDDRAVAANSRRALLIDVTPSAVVGLILGAVVAAVVAPLIGVVVFVVVTALLTAWFRARAVHAVVAVLGARPSEEGQHPRVHNLVEGLCATMGLPRPTIYVVDDPIPNALAVGREPRLAALVVTSGLDQSLSLVELEGVLAHELVHVKRRDTATAGAAVAVVAPLAAVTGSGAGLVRTLVGAGREFAADQRAASVVRYPPGLGSALETMTVTPTSGRQWPPGPGRAAAITRWLWIDPMVGARNEPAEGNLDDTGVRAAALAER
jgi:Zn-dependent protease with chaperone function